MTPDRRTTIPKSIHLPTEIAALRAAANEPKKVRQYVVRFSIPTAIRIIEDCERHGEQPVHCIRRIVEHHYGQDSGTHAQLELTDFQRRVVDVLCRETGESRDAVIGQLIQEFGPLKLSQINKIKEKEQQHAAGS